MGAKKKKGAANRLAKMSDEERAKYFQRKADAEEEARRRKEQLVATFMKNKLKKEDAFSRLNVAKINQQYHQTMRFVKCKEMKEDVKHLSQSIERIRNLKNRTIRKLMDDLDWQEDLYIKNFQTHTNHVQNLIVFHKKLMEELYEEYDKEKAMVLHIGKKERLHFENSAEDQLDYIKTINYGQNLKAEMVEKENHEYYIKQTDEMRTNYKTELNEMKKEKDAIIYALWKGISEILTTYIQRHDVRRSHLAELERLDSEGSAARAKNEKQILEQSENVEKLKQEYAYLVEDREEQIQNLKQIIQSVTKEFFNVRKVLNYEINLDQKRLIELTSLSGSSIDYLQELFTKGEKIQQFVKICSKFEWDGDRINKWAKFKSQNNLTESIDEDGDFCLISDFKNEEDKSSSSSSSLKPASSSSSSQTSSSSSAQRAKFLKQKNVLRPKTSIVKPKGIIPIKIRKKASVSSSIHSDIKVELKQLTTSPVDFRTFFTSSSKTSIDLGHSFDVLENLEGLWWTYNKVKIDCLALKQERKVLKKENDELKEIIRGVLEEAVLNKGTTSPPSATNSFYTKRRYILSAPV